MRYSDRNAESDVDDLQLNHNYKYNVTYVVCDRTPTGHAARSYETADDKIEEEARIEIVLT